MAEKAAHFSFTSEVKPSIFEIIAQNSLNTTLQPAFQRIIEFLAESNSKYFEWVIKYNDEAFLIFNGILQYYYLRNHDASFSEYFYGLQRISIKNIPLSKQQKHLSLVFLIVLPYIKQKLNRKLDVYKLENAEGLLLNDLKSISKKALLYSESIVEISWTVWLLLNYLRYMSDETESQNPILKLLKLKLIYGSESIDVISFWSSLFKGKLRELCKNTLRTSLEIGAFFVQFLQTWYREKSSYSITALPTVPPPRLDPNAENYRGKMPDLSSNYGELLRFTVSGYVFCYTCIVKRLREEQRCPVTNYPAKIVDLIRLYD
ncbi:peroxisome assembly protein 12 peroxin-12 [Holotrichia oblita]|uniref:Peroxisome assembly protein 12 peroxin-12 n=1 Tax=Holotrichia oblita TaxID=644536 RepID=A0ACB9SIF0_HOLOL|nr:peroxisome assembly protein 12 peroxin-12 [Holotrichia oblita]